MADEEKLANTTADITVAVIALLVGLALLGAYIKNILGWYNSFLNIIYDKNWSSLIAPAAIIFVIFDIALIVFIIFTLRQHAKLKRSTLETGVPAEIHTVPIEDETGEIWEEIRELANSQNPSEWNMAIIRADGLLDDVIQRLGYEGETMADRLKIMDPTKLPSLDRVWSAHRLRNTIVHGQPEAHTRETVIHALRSYELGLKELGVLKEKEAV